jgi:hypothetical protein
MMVIGADTGGVFSDDKIRTSSDSSSSGFIGGGQIGCDYQFAPAWVIGAECSAAWSSLKSNTPGLVNFPALGVAVPSQFTVSMTFWHQLPRGSVAVCRSMAPLRQRRCCLDTRKGRQCFNVPVIGDCRRSKRDHDPDRLYRRRWPRVGLRSSLVGDA